MNTQTTEKIYIPKVGDKVEMISTHTEAYTYVGKILFIDEEIIALRNEKSKDYWGRNVFYPISSAEYMRLYVPQKQKFEIKKAGELNSEQTVICRTDGENMKGKKYLIVNMEKPYAKNVYQKYKEVVRESIEELDDFLYNHKEQK